MKPKVIQVYRPGSGNSRTVGYISDLQMTKRGCVRWLAITREKRSAILFVDEGCRKKAIAGLLMFNVYGT